MNEHTELALVETPTAIMRKETDIATVCRDIVLKTACSIQGKKYVKVEGWMALATAHGCMAGSRDVQKVEGGWTAVGEIKRISDGVILSTAEGFVGKDEKRWGNADEYACRAMAQTRAISRACRAAFAHVIVLMDAGLSTTPAEEVPEGGFEENTARKAQFHPQPDSRRPSPKFAPAPAIPRTPVEATQEQKAKFVAVLKPVEAAAVEYAFSKGWIQLGEGLADIGLANVPKTRIEFEALMEQIQKMVDEVPPAIGELAPGIDTWRTVIVPIPPKGMTRAEYLKAPMTIDQLDKKTLFGWWANFQPKPWTGKDGTEHPPSTADINFRAALDAAGQHYEFSLPKTEKV